eukprot:TRINITY_DN4962_c0_g1_i1.p1 TRINITY_DN4962_c0_g1~~TRINITY_DN4962_c0_g1_i1.p1  ORF type:complete len:352 (+),score=72.50 TRINITY_DN4962_c0_g1_i1:45-1100(+)
MASTVDSKRVKEYYDNEEELNRKLDELVKMMSESKYTVFYTGAGVSTSAGVSDYRGPSGSWTKRKIVALRESSKKEDKEELKKLLKEQEQEKAKATKKVGSLDAMPTFCHMAMAGLIKAGVGHYVVTTNLDGLFRKAGLKQHDELCCLHGDIYVERCTGCGSDFERNYHVRASRHVHDHHVGVCPECKSAPPKEYTGKKKSGSKTGADGKGFVGCHLVGTQDVNVGTKDTHINFGECLDDIDWNEADTHCGRADLCIVMGTSMSLRHITHFPFMAKKTVIINLQATPDDKKCDLRLWATCDSIMEGVLDRLSLPLPATPKWRPMHPVPVAMLGKRGIDQRYIEAARRLESR